MHAKHIKITIATLQNYWLSSNFFLASFLTFDILKQIMYYLNNQRKKAFIYYFKRKKPYL